MAGKKKIAPNYLDKVPVRDSGHPWRTADDGTVEVDMEHRGFYHTVAQKLFKKPRVSHIALDKYGSVVWKSIDGKNTIGDIVGIMEEEFPDESERMIDRVVTFTVTLYNNRFIRWSRNESPQA